MKHLIKGTLAKFGYELRRIQINRHPPETAAIDPHERNSPVGLAKLWSDKEFVKSYLNPKRLELYKAALAFADNHGLFAGAASIVDVGCGPGYLLKLVSERYRVPRLLGLDLSIEALQVARQVCPGADFREHDVYVQIEDRFDALLSMEVLEHLLRPELALRNMLPMAKNVLLTVPNGRIDTFGGHINFWSLESWKIFLEPYRAGYHCVSEYICGETYLVTALRRIR